MCNISEIRTDELWRSLLKKFSDQGRSLYGERRLLDRHSKFSSWHDETAYNGTFSNVLMRILVPNAATLTRLSLAVLNFIDGQELRRGTVGVSVEQTSFLPDFQFRLFDWYLVFFQSSITIQIIFVK